MYNFINTSHINNVKWKNSNNNIHLYSAKLIKNNLGNKSEYNPSYVIQTNYKNSSIPGWTYPKHRPLNIPRKQYASSYNNGKSNISAIGVFDKPGISTKIDNNCDDLNCKYNNNFTNNITNFKNVKYDNCNSEKNCKFYDTSLNKIVCLSCNPENKIIKSASTIISPNYSCSTHELLYKRNKLYNQNLSTSIRSGNCCDDENYVTYKSGGYVKRNNSDPRNVNSTNLNNYASVSSSSRITKIKYETTQKFKSTHPSYLQQEKKVTNNNSECKYTNLIFRKNVNNKLKCS